MSLSELLIKRLSSSCGCLKTPRLLSFSVSPLTVVSWGEKKKGLFYYFVSSRFLSKVPFAMFGRSQKRLQAGVIASYEFAFSQLISGVSVLWEMEYE